MKALVACKLFTAAIVALSVSSSIGLCQTFPTKAMRIVVPRAPSGTTDLLARTVAQKLTEAWGQPVVVENRPGAGGNIGTEFVARSQPDGYNMLMAINSHTVNASFNDKLPYDPFKDFQPLILVATSPNVLVSHPSLPANTVQGLIKLAKAKPGELTYGSGGSGSGSHLAGVLFANMAGIKLVHVPYKGMTPGIIDLIGGQISLCFAAIGVVYPHVQTGKLKGIAVTSLKRSPQLPAMPTVSEAGLKGFDVTSWFGLLLPANTPKDIVAKLNAEIARITRLNEVQQKRSSQGVDLVGDSPQQFAAFMQI